MTNASLETQYQAAKTQAVLIDSSGHGQIAVRGADRTEFLHNLLSQDILRLKPGMGAPAALLNATGKVLALMDVLVFQELILLDTAPGLATKLASLLEKFIITEDVTLEIQNGASPVELQGPQSCETLEKILGPLDFSSEPGIDWVKAVRFTVVRGARPDCFAVFAPPQDRPLLLKKLAELGLVQTDSGGRELLRIEAGVPLYGKDVDETVSLPETGLDATHASETKGCYPGQEVVARTAAYKGLRRKLLRLSFEGAFSENPGLFSPDGKTAGRITSLSRLGEKTFVLAYVEAPWFNEPAKLRLGQQEK